jgi:predicted transcriptional regulator
MADRTPGRVALLSIHPRHAEAILQGEKRVELRRTAVAPDVTHVLIYATAPVQAVVGWFDVVGVDVDSKTGIWGAHGAVAGVTRKEFRDYFAGAARAVAIRVGHAQRLDPLLPVHEIPGVRRPPQSFQYLDRGSVEWLFAAERTNLALASG